MGCPESSDSWDLAHLSWGPRSLYGIGTKKKKKKKKKLSPVGHRASEPGETFAGLYRSSLCPDSVLPGPYPSKQIYCQVWSVGFVSLSVSMSLRRPLGGSSCVTSGCASPVSVMVLDTKETLGTEICDINWAKLCQALGSL